LAEQSLGKAPASEQALLTAGFAQLALGVWRLDRGESAEDALRQAELRFDQAHASHPRSTSPLFGRSRVHYLRAKARVAAAGNPTPDYDRAISDCHAAIGLDARDSYGPRCLVTMYSEKGDWQLEHGMDAEPTLAEAIAWASRVLAVNPDAETVRFALAVTQARLAATRQAAGRNPWEALSAAEGNLRRSAGQGHPLAQGSLGVVARLAGWFRLERGDDPTADLQRAREILEGEILRIPNRGFLRRELASVALLEARWTIRSGGRPRALVEDARRALADAERVEPGASDELALLRADLAEVEGLASGGRER
jgi:hypothetical protein